MSTSFSLLSNSIAIHALDHGGDGPALVLLPGLSANAHAFDGLVAAGLNRALRVIALDLRGRGLSDKPAAGYAMADHAADLIGALDALNLQRVILGGHSFGGLLTLYTAVHYPERVARAVVIDAAGELHPSVRELIKPSLDRLEQPVPSWEQYLDKMKSQSFLHGYWDDDLERYYRADVRDNPDGSVQPRSNPAAIWQAADLAIEEPWVAYLERIEQPVLLIRAPENYGPAPILPPEQAERTVRALADCTYREASGNHMTMLFGPHANGVVRIIVEWLRPDAKENTAS